MRRHRYLGALAAVAGVVLVGMSVAYACSPQYTISVRPGSAPAGTAVSVSGVGFKDGVVELRWQTASGPILGTVAGARSFTTSMTIPDSPPGVYYLVAQTADGAFASTAIEVVGAKPPAPPVEAAGSPPAVPEPQVQAAPAPAAAPVASRVASRPAAQPAVQPATAPAPAPTAAVAAPVAVAPEVTEADGVPVPVPAADPPPAPSPRSVSDDVLSGFGPGAPPLPGPVANQPGTSAGGPGVGVGLAVVGMAVLALGGGVAVARRRRAVPTQPVDR